MKKETFERAIVINQRIKDLNEILNEISPKQTHCLNYVDSDNKGCAEWRMKHIAYLLDKHDKMIRAEIQQEIDALNAEIETL